MNTDDAARAAVVSQAEEALVEAMAEEFWSLGYGGDIPTPYDRDQVGKLLAAARQVTIPVTCATCGGTGYVGGEPFHADGGSISVSEDCPDCSDGTVSRSALAVLAGGEQ